MRASSLSILALAAAVAAQPDVPSPIFERAKGWFDQAQQFIQSVAGAPKAAASAKVAEHAVTPLTFANWKDVIQHSGAVQEYNPPEAWMVYITGGNRTCGGLCERPDRAWNESIPYLVADPSAPHLAILDCENEEMLCGAWAAFTASIWMILVPQPQPDQSRAPTHITIHKLNVTDVTNADITKIHTRKLYLGAPKFEGALHPFDGWVAQYGLTTPMATVLYYLSKIPSWGLMVVLSFASRYFVNRRMPTGAPPPAAGAAGAAPAPGGAKRS